MLRTLELEIVRFVDDSQPGWVECRLVDAAAGVHRFVEKAPIVSELPLDRDSGYPRPGMLACTVVGERVDDAGEAVVVVDTSAPWGVASVDGVERFVVRRSQLRG